MSANKVTVINTGCANISSVKFAMERLGAQVTVSDDIAEIAKSERLILPGVGAAPAAMKSINTKHLSACIQNLTQPVLGVCLGMQLMVEASAENVDVVLRLIDKGADVNFQDLDEWTPLMKATYKRYSKIVGYLL